MSKPNKKATIVIPSIVVCILIYIVLFQIPRPVLFSWQTIPSYDTSRTIYHEDGTEVSEYYDENTIPIYDNNDNVIGVIDKNHFVSTLRETYCMRTTKLYLPYTKAAVLVEFSLETNNGPMYFVIKEEGSFWYRSGDDFFSYYLSDGRALYNYIMDSLQDYKGVIPKDTQKPKDARRTDTASLD